MNTEAELCQRCFVNPVDADDYLCGECRAKVAGCFGDTLGRCKICGNDVDEGVQLCRACAEQERIDTTDNWGQPW